MSNAWNRAISETRNLSAKELLNLKINVGPGYRVYYGKDGETLVLLLGGGSKKTQSRDISNAITRWKAYKRRKKSEE